MTWLIPTLNEFHEYSFEGKPKPGVTSILKAAGVIDDAWFSEQARERGIVVHKACALLAKGLLDWESVDERIIGYCLSFQKFIVATGFYAEHVEQVFYNEEDDYCGCFDLKGIHPTLDDLVIDLKSGGKLPWHGLQTAAYARMFPGCKRGTLYLDPTGKVGRFDLHRDRMDFARFLECRRGFDAPY